MHPSLLADSKNGYVYNSQLYTGKLPAGEDANVGATHPIVTNLSAPVYGRGHHIYMDKAKGN